MYRPLPTIHDDLETLRTRLRQTRDAEQKQRLRLLVLIGEGRVESRREAAAYLAVHRNSVGRWLACYEREGLEGLLRVAAGGAPAEQRTVSAAAFAALQARLREPEGFGSYGEIQQWLATEWGEEVAYQAVHRLVHRRLKAKLKRPRPTHPKKTLALRPRSPSAWNGRQRH
jgi:transposase